MRNWSLRTRLFLSCFIVSALLFCGIFFYLKGYYGRRELTRGDQAFEHAISQYEEFRREQQRSLLKTAGLLAATHLAGKEILPDQALFERLGADLVFLLDHEGNALSSSLRSENGNELQELTIGARAFFTPKVAGSDRTLILFGHSLYQVTIVPSGFSKSTSVGLGILFSGRLLEHLSKSTGLYHVLLRTDAIEESESGALALSSRDFAKIKASTSGFSRLELSSGHFLAKTVSAAPQGKWQLILLFPLAEFEQASRELLEAFLVAGLALMFLTTIFSQLLAREIARPLTALRDKISSMASEIGLEPPAEMGDEIRAITGSYLDFATHLQTALQHKTLAIDELEAYKSELLRTNSSLHRRLFQVKVLLSIWSERDKALDVRDFLSRFLEVLLPGLPFEYGCVIIRPLAEMGSETIFAKKIEAQAGGPISPIRVIEEEQSGKITTQWTDIIDPTIKEFLLQESEACIKSPSINVNTVKGCIRAPSSPATITVLSLRLKQGEEPLGSVHFLTEHPAPQITESLTDFLISLNAQVAAQLHIQALSFATRIDPLTRLYNRGYLNDRLREEVVRSSRSHQPFSLLLLDIDHFKQINEMHGRQTGDEALRSVAALMKRTCRGSDSVCRFSGPTLAILLADTPLAGAKIFAENVRLAVESTGFVILGGGTLKVTVSLGVIEFPTHGSGVEELIAQADHALLEAKRGGRNKWKTG